MTELKKPEPTIIDRVNAAAAKVSDVLMEARNAARDELLWLAAQYRELLAERDALAAENERLRTSAVRWSLEASKYAKKVDKAREREARQAERLRLAALEPEREDAERWRALRERLGEGGQR